ncbi:MAG: hypothetical protein JWO68_2985 [Actinomycetia bacterium]|nr:hypothetical protein [Actinomycetes bacterium]
MLTPLVLALVCLLPGLPLATLLARHRPGRTPWALLVVEALLLGLAWYLVVGLVLANRHDLGVAQVLWPTLAIDALVVGVLVLGPARRWAGTVDGSRPGLLGLLLAATFVAGAALRTKAAYFIYDIGDFGEYVNRGNVLADHGSFTQWFTQGFSVLLALSHVVLGEAHEVDVMGFLGLLVMAVALAIATRLGATPLARVVLAVVFAIGVVPTWFSNFPASETPYALMELALVLFLVTAVQTRHRPTAVVGGVVFAFLLMLMRGNAVLLLPVLVAVLVVSAPFVGREAFRVLAAFTASATAGLYAGFVYNARYNHPYFIDFQMPQFLPDKVWHRFADVGEVTPALWKGAVLAVAMAVLLLAARAVNGRLATRGDDPWVSRARAAVLPLALLVGVLALAWPLDAGGLLEGLGHYDGAVQALIVVGAVGAFVAFAGRLDDHVRIAVVFLVLVAEAFALLHAYRFPHPRYAPFFLYWDRYLWSDFFPAAMILGALGIGLIEIGWRRLGAPRVLTGAVAAVVAVAGVASLWSAGTVSRQHRFMGDAYGTLAQVDQLTGGLPIVYSGVLGEDVPKELNHPNTFRLFAQPLAETFGRKVYGIDHLSATGPDPRPTMAKLVEGMRTEGLTKVAFVEVLSPSRLPLVTAEPEPALSIRTLGTVRIDIPMLNRPKWRQPKHWRFARFRLAVREVVLR